ncbi:hypothetical protein [Bifidobacterium oedipodis]|uniref:Uncharacterized protein n=1 Tax=Bifidobacterium oedipodis TaxID=2675322 RepID=A0A7Y0EQG0_9BIFI|nr:hypothetical protein [Bifidobacterium sp. DSM 109957]NMM94123.1 hypothetical protein [Bifidobacterium sp. DSM 109957]
MNNEEILNKLMSMNVPMNDGLGNLALSVEASKLVKRIFSK